VIFINKINLQIAEISKRHIGKGIAIIDPKIVEENNFITGQIIELTGNKKSYVKLWSGSQEDYGSSIIKIDGLTRYNIGSGIGDTILIRKVSANNAVKITLSSTQKLTIDGLNEHMIDNYDGRVFAVGDTIMINTQFGNKLQLVVTDSIPSSPVIITSDTNFELGHMIKAPDLSTSRITYDDLGGLKKEIRKIREMIELPLRHPELFEKVGVAAPKGVLLYGPPGTGKTLLAKAVAGETNAYFISVSGPEIMGKYHGESEERLREIFKKAEEHAPSIIFIDEIDSIAPKREEVTGEVERRVVSQLLTLMDGINNRGKVIVIAATNRQDSIDSALRRPGRFDKEIEIGVPNYEERAEILNIHMNGVPIDDKVELNNIAKKTHGFVGADLQMLVKEAALNSMRRMLPQINMDDDKISSSILKKIKITENDFDCALKEIKPSALREILIQIPYISWNDVGGLDEIKNELREVIELPIKHEDAFLHVGAKQVKGILMHGPPGTGKTLLAKAIANLTQSNFISIKGPELLSKWVGESERGIREIFRKARQASPCIIFFDEIDSIIPKRNMTSSSNVTEKVVSQILTEIDGLEELHDVLIIGATNRLDIIDPALLRPGRFDRIIEVPNPNHKDRENIFKIHTKNKPIDKNVNLNKLAELTNKFNGAEIASVCDRSAILALKRYLNNPQGIINNIVITQNDFMHSIDAINSAKAKNLQSGQINLI